VNFADSVCEIVPTIESKLILDRHLSIVANVFRAAGCVLGLPSVAALICQACIWTSLRPGPPLEPTAADAGKYGFIGLLNSGAYGVGKAFEFFGEVSRWVAGVLALFTMATTLPSAGLYCTGRGLSRHALWARIAGGLGALGVALLSCGGILAFERGGAWICGLLAGAAAYVAWVLGWRFS